MSNENNYTENNNKTSTNETPQYQPHKFGRSGFYKESIKSYDENNTDDKWFNNYENILYFVFYDIYLLYFCSHIRNRATIHFWKFDVFVTQVGFDLLSIPHYL